MNKYDETKDVYEQISDSYLLGVNESYPEELPEFVSLLKKEDKVLEVGTAGGRDAKVIADAGMEVVGTDIIDSFLEKAKKLVPEATFINKDMRNLDFADEEFDAIWANAVLLHAERKDVPAILENLYRILKPSGKVHVRLKEGVGEAFRKDKLSSGQNRFFVYYSQDEVEQLFKDAGFKLIRSEIVSDERGRDDVKWISAWGEKI